MTDATPAIDTLLKNLDQALFADRHRLRRQLHELRKKPDEGKLAQWLERFQALKKSMGLGLPVALTEFVKGLVSARRHEHALRLIEAAVKSGNGSEEMTEVYSQCQGLRNS